MVWLESPEELAKQPRQSPLPWKHREDGCFEPTMPLRELALEAGAAAHGEASNDAGVVSSITCIPS
jgi:hypothetical protein